MAYIVPMHVKPKFTYLFSHTYLPFGHPSPEIFGTGSYMASLISRQHKGMAASGHELTMTTLTLSDDKCPLGKANSHIIQQQYCRTNSLDSVSIWIPPIKVWVNRFLIGIRITSLFWNDSPGANVLTVHSTNHVWGLVVLCFVLIRSGFMAMMY